MILGFSREARTAREQAEIGALSARVAGLQAELRALRVDRKPAIEAAQAQVEQISRERDQLRIRLMNAEAHAEQLQASAQSAEQLAVQIAARIGITEPIAQEGQASTLGGSAEELWAQYHKLPTAQAKREFYLKHKATLSI